MQQGLLQLTCTGLQRLYLCNQTSLSICEPGCPFEESGEIFPIRQQVNNTRQRCRFMGIAEQMGRTLQRTSISVNIKERLDFSCALFGPDGALVANAPHLPVHLGAMSEANRFQVRLGCTSNSSCRHTVTSQHSTTGSHVSVALLCLSSGLTCCIASHGAVVLGQNFALVCNPAEQSVDGCTFVMCDCGGV